MTDSNTHLVTVDIEKLRMCKFVVNFDDFVCVFSTIETFLRIAAHAAWHIETEKHTNDDPNRENNFIPFHEEFGRIKESLRNLNTETNGDDIYNSLNEYYVLARALFMEIMTERKSLHGHVDSVIVHDLRVGMDTIKMLNKKIRKQTERAMWTIRN